MKCKTCFFVLVLSTVLIACNSNDDFDYPKVKNDINFAFNELEWKTFGQGEYWEGKECWLSEASSRCVIKAIKTDIETDSIWIFYFEIEKFSGIGDYGIINVVGATPKPGAFFLKGRKEATYYVCDSSKVSFNVSVTKFEKHKNYSFIGGDFEGILYNRSNSNDSIMIRNGEFDLTVWD